MPNPSAVLVTGASGYVGAHLIAHLTKRGYQVHALARRANASAEREGVRFFRYRMGEGPDPRAFANVQAVVHAAANTLGETDTSDETERSAAEDLLDIAEQFAVARFIYVSSLAARADGSRYGRLKWRIERGVLQRGGYVVRPGLVYGGEPGHGLFGLLDQFAATSPCIPAFVPAPHIHPIHIDDLCQAMVHLVGEGARSTDTGARTFAVAQQESVSLNAFMRRLAWHRHRRHPISIPVPSLFVMLATALAKAVPLVSRQLVERLDGFAQLGVRRERLLTQCEELAVVPRPLADGLATGGARRNLLDEGLALTTYAAGRALRPVALRRYARAVERSAAKHVLSRSLDLRPIFLACPRLLRLLDARSPILRRQSPQRLELDRRLPLAVALAETDPQVAPAFHWRAGSALPALTALVLHFVCDVLLQVFSALSRTGQWMRRKSS